MYSHSKDLRDAIANFSKGNLVGALKVVSFDLNYKIQAGKHIPSGICIKKSCVNLTSPIGTMFVN